MLTNSLISKNHRDNKMEESRKNNSSNLIEEREKKLLERELRKREKSVVIQYTDNNNCKFIP